MRRKANRKDRVIWIDRGHQPTFVGFCPTRAAWKREMRRLKVDDPPEYPEHDASVTPFRATVSGSDCVLICINDRDGRSPVEVIGLLVHECTHVWQHIRKNMREHEPSSEFEAYTMQGLIQEVVCAYESTRTKLFIKK